MGYFADNSLLIASSVVSSSALWRFEEYIDLYKKTANDESTEEDTRGY